MGEKWIVGRWCADCDECRLRCGQDFTRGPLRLLHRTPFGRGFTKSAFAGTWHGSAVVIKLPNSEDAAGRFIDMHYVNTKAAARVPGNYPYRIYGGCFEGQRPYEVAEAGLARFEDLLKVRLRWCYRVHLAWQIVHFGAALEQRGLCHCDWQISQTAVDASAQFRLLDLKSIKQASTRLIGWPGSDSRSRDGSERGCQHSHGYRQDMAQITVTDFLRPLLLHPSAVWDYDSTHTQMVEALSAGLGHHTTTRHWSFVRAATFLQEYMNRTRVQECVKDERNSTAAMLMKAATIKNEHMEKCKYSKYCRRHV